MSAAAAIQGPPLAQSVIFSAKLKKRRREMLAEIVRHLPVDREAIESGGEQQQRKPQHHDAGLPASRAIARQPMSLRQKPPGQSMRAIAS